MVEWRQRVRTQRRVSRAQSSAGAVHKLCNRGLSGVWRDVGNGGLVLQSSQTVAGADATGAWVGLMFTFSITETDFTWITVVRDYTAGNADCVVFEQYFPDALVGTAGPSTNDVATVFPALAPAAGAQLGFLNYWGNMACQGGQVVCTDVGTWTQGVDASMRAGLDGGSPLVLFNESSAAHAIVISPYSNFMASGQVVNNASGNLECGIMGGVNAIPAGFRYETLLSYGRGVNAAMRVWGATLLGRSGKTLAARDADLVVQYLGYWTDNGAYYYYMTEPSKTYTETLVDVLGYANAAAIPFHYMQLDSYWYYRGTPSSLFGGGVKNWTAMQSVFPNGLADLHNRLRVPLVAHNRFWSGNCFALAIIESL